MTKSLSMRDSLYLSDDPQETTFKYDQSLPSLPLPSIEQSIDRLLESIRPIAPNEQAYQETVEKAIAFKGDANVKELHRMLEKRASSSKNWLEQWWLEFAYLRSRKPLIPYSNMAAPLPIMSYWPVVTVDEQNYNLVRAKRAALSTYFQLCFWRMLRHEQMRPMIHKGIPWSMNQFRYLFNTVRRPGEPKDELVSWFKTVNEGLPESVEIIVLYRGHVFSIKPVTMLNAQKACILPAPLIERQLRYIEQWCEGKPPGPGVGSLATNERSVWFEARNELARVSPKNQEYLVRIDRALSVLVLDDNEPRDTNEIFALSMCGDPSNRWPDKSITSIAFKNGTFGASADHTPYDGFCTGIMTHYLISSVQQSDGQWSDSMMALADSNWAAYIQPELFEFQLSPQTRNSISESIQHFNNISSTIDVLHQKFPHFGKAILKEYRLHPEAFVQCAIHAAYYKSHKQMAPAYVTASTRRFFNGRTETCRSCYPEMREFVLFIDKNGANQPRQAYNLLKSSVTQFQKLMDEASRGQGCDRHLLGLYLMAILEGKNIPEIFDDDLVQRTNNYILSTSCSGYWNVCGGVPPLVEEGYGCFYGIEDDAITFGCTAYKSCKSTDLKAFYHSICEVLLDMQKILLVSRL